MADLNSFAVVWMMGSFYLGQGTQDNLHGDGTWPGVKCSDSALGVAALRVHFLFFTDEGEGAEPA